MSNLRTCCYTQYIYIFHHDNYFIKKINKALWKVVKGTFTPNWFTSKKDEAEEAAPSLDSDSATSSSEVSPVQKTSSEVLSENVKRKKKKKK